MSVKVSVIIPVYNPGPYIEPCIDSLLRQTMPADDFEAIFVDDGSTDDSPARLDALAAEHPNIRVIHQENSGWPGKPRNVGVAAARGEYVQFVDQDDALGIEALERLYAIGSRNDADIVIGKVTSDFRGVPHGVFRRNVERCTIYDFPLIDSLTPHKMFRKAFLEEHGISYPEGKRRLEDQLYMVETYLAATSVSILGDYPCYYYLQRGDGKNAGSARIDPAGYYDNLREVLRALEAGTEPGGFRDGLLRRFYRNELLGRLSEPAVQHWPEDYRQELFDEVRRISAEHFPDHVPDGLAVVPRIRSVLVRENRLDDLVALADRLEPVRGRSRLTGARWKGGSLAVDVSAELRFDDDSPVLLVERDGRLLLDPRIVGGCVDDRYADVTADVADARAEVVIRDRKTELEWFVSSELTAEVVPSPEDGPGAARLVFTGSAELDPLTLAGGPLPRATWDVYVRLHALGIVKRVRLGDPALADGAAPEPALLGPPTLVVVPLYTDHGNLTLDVNEHVRWLAGELARRGVAPRPEHGRIATPLPVHAAAPGLRWPARVTLDSGTGTVSCTLPAAFVSGDDGVVLTADLWVQRQTGPVAAIRPGTYRMLLHSGTRGLPAVAAGEVEVGRAPVRLRGVGAVRERGAGVRVREVSEALPAPAARGTQALVRRLRRRLVR